MFRDHQRRVEFPQREVRRGDIAHQRCYDGFAIFFRAQQIRARGFGGSPQFPPDIEVKRE
jgi:hypothetical protein